MSAIPSDKLDRLVQRWEEIQAELNRGVNPATYAPAHQGIRRSQPGGGDHAGAAQARSRAARSHRAHERSRRRKGPQGSGAGGVRPGRSPSAAELQEQLRVQLLPKDAADEKSAILEVRAGTGGDEAALFAADLFRMYSRYAEQHGWKTDIISASENDLGGYKEIVASIAGKGVFARLKYESGVHRVQRIPAHRGGRAHPHLGRDGCGPARGGGRRPGDQARGHPHRHHARGRCGRPARQQDRFGRPHHPPADRPDRCLGREVAAPEPPSRHAGAALAALRAWSARRRTMRVPPSAGARSVRATVRSASAPTISRRGASPTTASA